MPTKKGDRRPKSSKGGRGPTQSKGSSNRPRVGAAPSALFDGVIPTLQLRSALLGPDPAPSEEVLFDLGQLTASRPYGSAEELNDDLIRLTAAGPIPRSASRASRGRGRNASSTMPGGPPRGKLERLSRSKPWPLIPIAFDAHLFLAVNCGESEDVLTHAFKAVEAGERSVAQDEESAPEEGHLWTYLPARPYLRARAFLARCLWTMGGRLAAVSLMRESLSLEQGCCPWASLLLLGLVS